MVKNKSTLTGAAGELFVMYRLCRMGYIAALAPKGVPNADLIVTDVEGNLTAVVQVKTRNNIGADGGWAMKTKHENLKSKNLFYCFVDFISDDEKVSPVVHIIPSETVAETIAEAHKIWLSIAGQGGRAHKDTDMRRFLPDYSKALKVDNIFIKNHGANWLDPYKENWTIMNLC